MIRDDAPRVHRQPPLSQAARLTPLTFLTKLVSVGRCTVPRTGLARLFLAARWRVLAETRADRDGRVSSVRGVVRPGFSFPRRALSRRGDAWFGYCCVICENCEVARHGFLPCPVSLGERTLRAPLSRSWTRLALVYLFLFLGQNRKEEQERAFQ